MSTSPDAAPTAGNIQRTRGSWGEQLAADYLTKLGYRIINRNYSCYGGEIDLIAFDGQVLCFIEVRTRQNSNHGNPLETITPPKITRVVRAANDFLDSLPLPWPDEMRFDAVGIIPGEPPQIELIRDAFDASPQHR